MKSTNKRLMLLCIYIGVCLVFWMPYLRCFVTHKPIGDRILWNALLVPSLPLMICFHNISMDDIRALLFQPVYLALIFSPFLAVGIKPALWEREGWRFGIGIYAIGFICTMLVSALFVALVIWIGPS